MLERHRLTLSDGACVDVARTADRPVTILAVNALGMPTDCWAPLAEQLAARGRGLVVWASRGVPSPDAEDLSLPRLLADAEEVLDWSGAAHVDLIGWCTGARLGLRLAQRLPARVRRAVLVAGAWNLDEPGMNTKYQQVFTSAMGRLAQKRRLAEAYYRMVHAPERTHRMLQERASTILGAVEPGVEHLATRPYQSADDIYAYARLIHSFHQDRAQDWLAALDLPALFLCGDQDETTVPDASRVVAERVPGARYTLLPGCGHFALVLQPERVAAAMLSFLDPDRSDPHVH